jgi:hypothetical protein
MFSTSPVTSIRFSGRACLSITKTRALGKSVTAGTATMKDREDLEDLMTKIGTGYSNVAYRALEMLPEIAEKTRKAGETAKADKPAKEKSDEAVKKQFADKPKVKLLRAPAGGKVSDVDGKHYKGGWLMPVHGLSPKVEKKPKGEGPTQTPPVANEDSKRRQRGEPREMTKEEIADEKERRETEKKWGEIRSGPVGKVLWLGERPHYIKRPEPGLRNWQEWADTVPDAKLQELRDVARDIAVKAMVAKEGEKGAQEYRDYFDQYYANAPDSNNAKYMKKKHVREKPTSPAACSWFGEAVEYGGIDAMQKLNQVMAGTSGDIQHADPDELLLYIDDWGILQYARRHHKSGEGQGFFNWGAEQEAQHPRGQPDNAGQFVKIGHDGESVRHGPGEKSRSDA